MEVPSISPAREFSSLSSYLPFRATTSTSIDQIKEELSWRVISTSNYTVTNLEITQQGLFMKLWEQLRKMNREGLLVLSALH